MSGVPPCPTVVVTQQKTETMGAVNCIRAPKKSRTLYSPPGEYRDIYNLRSVYIFAEDLLPTKGCK